MKIVFFSNFINHHQVHLCDALYKMTEGQFTFVQTKQMPDSFRKSGYPDYTSRPYVLIEYQGPFEKEQANKLAKESDVMIIGSAPIEYEVARVRNQREGMLTFEYSERSLKKGWLNLLSPKLLESQFYYHTLFYKKPVFKLCASAYTAYDMQRLHSFKDNCFKWGYFTEVSKNFDIRIHNSDSLHSIIWCARFIKFKHPEMPIELAKKLKEDGYYFSIDMYGSGELLEASKMLANELKVNDVVNFCGNVSNQEVLEAMRGHELFLFTSDQQEGWGAVLNEAMSVGCVPIASKAIGSVPFLVEHGKNGLTFESENIDSLYKEVKSMLDNPQKRQEMSRSAYETMINIWSPQNAAKNFLQLCDALNGKGCFPVVGPGSKAN